MSEWATLLTALSVAIPSIVGSILSIATFVIALRARADVAAIKVDVKTVEVATNSMKDALVAATKKASHAEGVVSGRADEKAKQALKAEGAAAAVAAGLVVAP